MDAPKIKKQIKKQKKNINQKEVQKQHLKKHKVNIHVLKFLKIYPQQIQSITKTTFQQKSYIAISRIDSSIEIWETQSWTQLQTYQLSKNENPVHIHFQSLSEKEFPYLLVFASNGSIILLTIDSLFPKHILNTPGGYIWGIEENPQTKEILTANEDGYLRLFQISEEMNTKIVQTQQIRNFEERALSVTYDFDNPQEFYASYESGQIRKFNNQKNVVTTMTVADQNKKKIKTLAWKIKGLTQNQLVAACSDGFVRIFETKFGTLFRSFQKHEADINCIYYNYPKNLFYVTGSDSKISVFKNIQNEWLSVSEYRGQSHDIKGLELLEDNRLISVGITTDIAVYPLDQEGVFTGKVKHVVGINQNMAKNIIIEGNLCLLMKAFSIELWEFDVYSSNYQLLYEINTQKCMLSAALSSQFLAYSTSEESYLFQIHKDYSKKITQLHTFEPSSLLSFSKLDSKKLFFVQKKGDVGYLNTKTFKKKDLCELDWENSTNILIGDEDKSIFIGCKYLNKIVQICAFTGKILFDVPPLFNQFQWVSFNIVFNKFLVITYSNRQFGIYNIEKQSLSKWTKNQLNQIPKSFTSRQNPLLGILQHPQLKKRLIIYASDSLSIVDFKGEMPRITKFVKENDENVESFCVKQLQKPIVYAQNFENNILCVEIDFQEMLETLPNAIIVKKFGL